MTVFGNRQVHWYVFGGRFQPFHLGHLEVLRYIVEILKGTVVIGIINPDPTTLIPGDGNDWVRFSKDLNPLNFWERSQCISESLRDIGLQNQITIVPLPRPSVNLKKANQYLPPQPRSFVLCQRWGDEIEGWKATKYKANGDNVFWVPSDTLSPLARLASSELIRSLIVIRNDVWRLFVSHSTADYMINSGLVQKIAAAGDQDKALAYLRELFVNEARASLVAEFMPEHYALAGTMASPGNKMTAANAVEVIKQLGEMRIDGKSSARSISINRLHIGDTYVSRSTAAMGAGAQGLVMNWQELERDVDLSELANQLKKLHSALESQANNQDHADAVKAIATAEQAAAKGQGQIVMEQLAKAGKWALEKAADIGTDLLSDLLKKSLGLK